MAVDISRIPKSRYDAIQAILAMGNWPLYFFGQSGRGKSFMAALIFAEWEQRIWKVDAKHEQVLWQHEPIFWKAGEIVSELLDARYRNKTGLIKKACDEAGLIVIDDIIDRAATDARQSAILDLIEWRGNKPLILTGNFDLNELVALKVDDRIIDRIQKGRQVKFSGPSLRASELEILEV